MGNKEGGDKIMAGLWSGWDSTFDTQTKEMDEKLAALLKKPRVIKAKDYPAKNTAELASGQYNTRMVDTSVTGLSTNVAFFADFPAHSCGPNHGHMNPAVFYILEGKGHELHDGKTYPWEAGDVVIVPEGCVHRQVNDGDVPAIALVINPKPTYVFMNLFMQRLVNRPGEGPTE